MKKLIIAASSALVLAAFGTAAQAAFINGSFETGNFDGWTTSGSVGVVGGFGSPAVTPAAGSFQAGTLVPNNSPFTTSGSVQAIGALETFFGLSSGSFNAARTTGTVQNGSGVYQNVTVAAGDTISFRWNFGTIEGGTTTTYNDYGFVVIGTTVSRLQAVNDNVNGALAGPSVVASDRATYRTSGYRTFSTVLATAGTYRVGFGAIGVGDSSSSSFLLADNFVQTPAVTAVVPEPATWGMMLLGFGLVGRAMRSRRRTGTFSAA